MRLEGHNNNAIIEFVEKQKLILIRDFLFKTFVVSFIFALLLFLITKFFWNNWSSLVYSTFQVSPSELGTLVVNSFLYLRLYLVFVLLVPAISLHWLIKSR